MVVDGRSLVLDAGKVRGKGVAEGCEARAAFEPASQCVPALQPSSPLPTFDPTTPAPAQPFQRTSHALRVQSAL